MTTSRRDAAEAALRSVLPHRVARVVMIESRAWRAFARRLRGRRLSDGEFAYGRELRPLLLMVIGVLVIEGAVVEFVVAMMFGHGWWLWLLAALHLYALAWIVGIAASLRTMPHHVGRSAITLRDSIFDEYPVPVAAISGVRTAVATNTGRSGLRIDASGNDMLCHGDGTVSLTLRDETTIRGNRVRQLTVSADRPADFVAACRTAISATN
ncbi:hypothetical protein ACXVUM_12875 [Williamsia sp. SKLECPSW1]